MSDVLLKSALALAECGIYSARAWGVRPSVGRGWRCCCNDEQSTCRVGLPGAHAVHASPTRAATRDPDVIAGWRRAHGGENLLALCGAKSRLTALEFPDPEALWEAQRRFGRLPETWTSQAPSGAVTAWFRWARPSMIAPDGLGGDVRVHSEAARLLVPGSRLLDGVVEWVVSPAEARLTGLPMPWRAAILEAPRRRASRAV